MFIRDLMHKGLITCPPGTHIGEAAALLAAHQVHALVVAEPDGSPLGVLSDTDLLAGEWLSTDDASLSTMQAMTAGELMSTPPAAISADAKADEAATRMREERLSRLLVSEAGTVIGVIAISDLVRGLVPGSRARDTVADVMSWAIVTCLEETPLAAAARGMSERRSRSIVAVDRHGALVGVVSGHDLIALYGSGDLNGTVADLMNPPITISPTASLREAADRMLDHEIHRLVVVDPGDPAQIPLGLVSTSDIVAEMAAPNSIWQTH